MNMEEGMGNGGMTEPLIVDEKQRHQSKNGGSIYMVLLSTFVAVCGSFQFGSCVGYSAPAQSGIMEDLGLSLSEYSTFGSLMNISAMIGAVMSGRIADLIGRKKVPVFIAEIAPKNLRGALTSVNQLMISCGASLSFVIGTIVTWRTLALIGLIPCLVSLLGLFFVPESPRWLAKMGKHKEFDVALRSLRGKGADISEEAEEIQIGVGLMVFQQFGGINGVVFYASELFVSAGLSSGGIGIIAMACLSLPITALSAIIIDRCGRRPLLMVSTTGTFIGLFLTGMCFYMKGLGLLTKWIPVLVLIGILVYDASFSVGMGAVPWVIMSEIFPINIKGSAGSLVTLMNWLGSWIVSYSFNFLMSWSSSGTFFLYSTVCAASVVFVVMMVPETKGEDNYLYKTLWKACAGPLVYIPRVGERVVYFPQGHIEQVEAYMNQAANPDLPVYDLPYKITCRVVHVQLNAECETDEVFLQLTLLPEAKQETNAENETFQSPPREPHVKPFLKILSSSDACSHGQLTVPKRCADEYLPALDYSQETPNQELVTKDLHGIEWRFRHTYRGTPKRHLLMSGWSKFVNSKRLMAGDAFILLRASPSGFVVPYYQYMESIQKPYSVGKRFMMRYEGVDNITRYSGTIVPTEDVVSKWPGSKWKSLKVLWDETSAVGLPDRVSPWEIEPIALTGHKRQYPIIHPLLVHSHPPFREGLTNSSVEHSPPTSPVGVLQGQENSSPDQNQHHHGDPHSPKEAGDLSVVLQPVWLFGVDLSQIPVKLLSQRTATSHRMESPSSKLVASEADHLLEQLKNARSLSSSFTMNVAGTSYNEGFPLHGAEDSHLPTSICE
ncbi:Sugar transporter ERD6-like 16 [Acorus gramineus]|uniref:Sugar transporter ERD6-like 16 n=1 Tax=Acorus gramineus TaxID=55184 RepID=A0AAV9BQL8_ACOGR|nr:Sugar transporter ERD6-like 16 [Acorus gramineus]